MKRMLQRRMAGVICLTILAALFWPGMPIASSAADPEELPKAEETSSEPVQFVKDEGSIALEFTDVNAAAGSFEGKADYLALFTSGATVTDATYGPVTEVWIAEGQVALIVDAEGVVQEVLVPWTILPQLGMRSACSRFQKEDTLCWREGRALGTSRLIDRRFFSRFMLGTR